MICLIIQKTALLRRCDIHFPWKVGIKTGAEQSGKPPENFKKKPCVERATGQRLAEPRAE